MRRRAFIKALGGLASLTYPIAGMPLFGIPASAAASITIVALGTSNTRGRGVSPQDSYPAQLQAMLRAKGLPVQVINMGVNGDTTVGMLARLSAVPNGTRLVLLESWPNNEARGGVTNTSANLTEIQSRLAARNIKVLDVTVYFQAEHRAAGPAGNLVSTPAGPHLNGTAYSHVAAQLLPQVEAAIGR